VREQLLRSYCDVFGNCLLLRGPGRDVMDPSGRRRQHGAEPPAIPSRLNFQSGPRDVASSIGRNWPDPGIAATEANLRELVVVEIAQTLVG